MSDITGLLDRLREQILAKNLSRRNDLINKSQNAAQLIRIIDEDPNFIFDSLVNKRRSLNLKHLMNPSVSNLNEEVSEEEQAKLVGEGLALFNQENQKYEWITEEDEDETNNKNKYSFIKKTRWAKAIEINPQFEVPYTDGQLGDAQADNDLQTLLYEDELVKKNVSINRRRRTDDRDMGIKSLYISLGFLEWIDSSNNKKNLSPLVLVPLSIELDRLRKAKISCNNEDIETNLALLKKLEKIEEPIGLPKLDEDIDNLDLEEYYRQIEDLIKERDDWKVRRYISIGIFNLSGIEFYNDLDPTSWPSELLENDPFLLQMTSTDEHESYEPSRFEEFDIDQAETEERLHLPLESDPSQYKAIKEAKNGANLIVSGPPGTGKSQTISNMVSQFIYDKKTVLIVSEKAVALEVVKRNLDSVGLGQLCFSMTGKPTEMINDLKVRFDQKQVSSRAHQNRMLQEIEENTVERRQLTDYLNNHANLMKTEIDGHQKSIFEILTTTGALKKELNENNVNLGILEDIASGIELERNSYVEQRANLLEFNELAEQLTEYDSLKDHPWFGWNNTAIMPNQLENNGYLEVYIEAISSLIDKIADLDQEGEETENLSKIDKYQEYLEIISNNDLQLTRSIAKIFHENPFENSQTALNIYENQYLPNKNRLSKAIKNLEQVDENNLNELVEVVESGPLLSKKILQIEKHELLKKIEDFSHSIQDYNQSSEQIKNLSETLGIEEVSSFDSFRLLKRFTEFFEAHDKYIPDERNNLFNNDELDGKLDFLEITIKEIKQKIEELKKFLNTDLADYESCTKHYIALNNPSWWKKFYWNKDYREAKTFINKVTSTSTKQSSAERLANFNSYYKTLKRSNDLDNDQSYKDLLMDYFKGAETNISKIKKIRSFYKDVNNKFSGSFHNHGKKILNLKAHELISMGNAIDSEIKEKIERIYDNTKAFHTISQLTTEQQMSFFSSPSMKTIDEKISKIKKYLEPFTQEFKISELTSIRSSIPEFYESIVKIEKNINSNLVNLDSHEINNQINDLKIAKQIYDATQKYRISALEELLSSQGSIDQILDTKTKIEELSNELTNFKDKKETFYSFGQIEEPSWHDSATTNNFSLTLEKEKCENALQSFHELEVWIRYSRVSRQLQHSPSQQLKIELENGRIDLKQLRTCFKFIYYSSLTKKLWEQHPELAEFDSTIHQERRKRFREIDKDYLSLLPKTILERSNLLRFPGGSRGRRVRQHTEGAYLSHEFGKQTRHFGARTMMNQAVNAITSLKPCLMMRPTDVCKYLKKEKIFDVVIMDEASQVSPEKAIGSLLRANQFILAGDTKQLPPTIFFNARLNEEDVDEMDFGDDSESVLESAEKIVPRSNQLLLNWHYRSKHHSLINFSNHYFYDNKLRIFRSPSEQNQYSGVTNKFVENAVIENNKNTIEAEAVIEEVMDHMKNRKQESLMVVSMNAPQKAELERIYDHERQKPENGFMREYESFWENTPNKEIFDIKNLENVQGDERDVVFISYTYAKNPEGNVYQNFRFASSQGGWKAFNVLFTRAKQRVRVFSSITPSDVRGEPGTMALGKRAFRAYLEYADTGNIPGITNVRGEPENDFERAIGNAIANQDFKVDFQVGFEGFIIDMAIRDPRDQGRYILGVEADGATYHSSPSARSRDRYRQDILESRGWEIHRIWSTDWFSNPDEEIRKVVARIQDLLHEESLERIPAETIELNVNDNNQITVEDEPQDISLYDRTRETTRDYLINFRENSIRRDFPNENNDSILRDTSLNAFLHYLPTNRNEYTNRIDQIIREQTNPDEANLYLDQILQVLSKCDPNT